VERRGPARPLATVFTLQPGRLEPIVKSYRVAKPG
jgi:hypothetical protein